MLPTTPASLLTPTPIGWLGEASLLAAGAFAFSYLAWGALLGFGYAWLEAESEEPEPRGPDGERDPSDPVEPP
jgi:hypothetical protein